MARQRAVLCEGCCARQRFYGGGFLHAVADDVVYVVERITKPDGSFSVDSSPLVVLLSIPKAFDDFIQAQLR